MINRDQFEARLTRALARRAAELDATPPRFSPEPAASRVSGARIARRARGWGARLLPVASVLVALGVGSGAIAVLHAGYHPRSSARLPQIPAAASPEQALDHVLGVLRRPQTTEDRNPTIIRGLERISRQVPSAGAPILSTLRFALEAPWGTPLYLVETRYPTRRKIEQIADRVTPSRARRRALKLMLKFDRHPGGFRGAGFAPGGGGFTASEIEAGEAWATGGFGPHAHGPQNYILIIVPDGVARVTLTIHPTSVHPHPTTLSTTVHGNVAAFESPVAVENVQAQTTMHWYNANGQPL